jgi:hypothetical protein
METKIITTAERANQMVVRPTVNISMRARITAMTSQNQGPKRKNIKSMILPYRVSRTALPRITFPPMDTDWTRPFSRQTFVSIVPPGCLRLKQCSAFPLSAAFLLSQIPRAAEPEPQLDSNTRVPAA